MTPLTEQDIADIQADLRMEQRALELHLDREPLPHLVDQHRERTRASQLEIARLRAMLEGES